MTQEQIFNEKINHFLKHTKFQWLREYADEAFGNGYYVWVFTN